MCSVTAKSTVIRIIVQLQRGRFIRNASSDTPVSGSWRHRAPVQRFSLSFEIDDPIKKQLHNKSSTAVMV